MLENDCDGDFAKTLWILILHAILRSDPGSEFSASGPMTSKIFDIGR